MAGPGEKRPEPDLLELIGDPLRVSVVRYLEEQERGSLQQLAKAAGVHPNTLRPHMVELEEAGLVTSERRVLPTRRGRPGVDYRLASSWDRSRGGFVRVAELLAAALGRLGPKPQQLRKVGNEWGRYLLGRPGTHDVETELPRVLGELGYETKIEGGRLTITRCPCPIVAPDRPELFCRLAEGVIEGALAASGDERRATGFEHDPSERHCCANLD